MDLWELRSELGLKKHNTNSSKNGYEYKGVMATGDFDGVYDYNVGLLNLFITNPINPKFPKVIISTVDDGVWQGYGNNEIDPEIIAKEFEKEFGETKLPTEAKLNEFLLQYGIFGTYNG